MSSGLEYSKQRYLVAGSRNSGKLALEQCVIDRSCSFRPLERLVFENYLMGQPCLLRYSEGLVPVNFLKAVLKVDLE
jgi:hypothetical protein